MLEHVRYLLLQIRNPDDPMRNQEVDCFARALGCERYQVGVYDLLAGVPSRRRLDAVDVVLLGGSGHYSVASEGEWLDRALEAMRELHRTNKPTFASCWGFQAMARGLGGRVIHDPEHAEVGTRKVRLTAAGAADPVFSPLGREFDAQMGHGDRVVQLPPGATLLASSDRVSSQAFRFEGKPIYCTQFHPELNRTALLERLQAYPEYIRLATGLTMEDFMTSCRETPETETLLPRFVQHVLRAS